MTRRGAWALFAVFALALTFFYPAALTQLPADLGVPRADWPQWGGSGARNNVRRGQSLVDDWDVGQIDNASGEWIRGSGRNIRWAARLGSNAYGTPVVAHGKVLIATNNMGVRIARLPQSIDLGCLLCLRESNGEFLWQYSSEKLPTGRVHDWPMTGICSTPLVMGDRLWLVTNRCKVVCLDSEGFADGENDGPFRDEPNDNHDEADIVWSLDMRGRLGVEPHNMSNCSVTSAGRLLFVCTSNGLDVAHVAVEAPNAPSFIALDKATGEVVWTDNSPGDKILHGQWSSPAYAVIDGVPQVVFGGGDGWLYSFDPAGDGRGGSKLHWKFDCNGPAPAAPARGGRPLPIVGTPVIHGNLVYATIGDDPEHGEGPGHLWCIAAEKRGDVSRTLVVERGNPVGPPPEGVIAEPGDEIVPNPNSACAWDYTGRDLNGDGVADFEDQMHRTVSTAVVEGGLLVIPDFSGLVHCLDAETGKPLWTHDVLAAIWSSPLVADGKVYVGDEEGKVTVLKLSRTKRVLREIRMPNAVYSTPIAAGGVLYVAAKTHLFAIGADP